MNATIFLWGMQRYYICYVYLCSVVFELRFITYII